MSLYHFGLEKVLLVDELKVAYGLKIDREQAVTINNQLQIHDKSEIVIAGKDLMEEFSLEPGPELGKILKIIEEKIVKNTNKKTVIKNLLQCVDVINFGTAFTVKESNIKIDGVVQFNEGMNKYKDAETVRDVVLSPFKNSNKAEAENNTLGQRAVITEAHFFYNFTVNPLDFKDIGATGYTEEAYNDFKSGCLSAVTNLNTVSKAGCLNEFAMFIELNDEAHNLLTNLNYRVKFYKKNNKKVIDLSDIIKDIEDIEENIKEIEIFFNPNNTEVIFNSNILIKKTIGKNINRPSKLAPISIPENTDINNEDNSIKHEVIGE